MKCLYNGHPAPELPAYSQSEFPYALIVSANADNTALILMLCVNRPYYGTNPEDSTKTGVYNTGRMKVYTCTDTDEAWSFSMETENPLTANDDDPGGGVIWTRENILKTGEQVWMAGSEPVPMGVSESWIRSFKTGLALGLMGAPLPYTGKEPVAYKYNGVRLPKLPEWYTELYKKTYPYVVIYDSTKYGPGYYLYLCSMKPIPTSSTVYFRIADADHPHLLSICESPFSEWGEAELKSNGVTVSQSNLVWVNTDFVNEDGSVYFAASDPVPVYE